MAGSAVARNKREIRVVADGPHRAPDRGIDRAIRQASGPQPGGDGVGEERADRDASTGLRVQADDLAVVAEPAVNPIDGVQDGLDRGPSRCQVAVMDDETDARPDRPPVGALDLGHEPPEVACAEPVDVVVGVAVACRLVDPVVESSVVVDDDEVEPPDVVVVVVTAAVVTSVLPE